MVPFDKNTTKSLKEIEEENPLHLNEIYRVYKENSNIPLYQNSKGLFENDKFSLSYGKESYDTLYLFPNYIPEHKKIKTQSFNMQYDPKLKKAAQEIQKILTENDIAGFVVLHSPGFGEYVLNLSPTYSCIKVDPNSGTIRAKAKLQEDFDGNKQAWEETIKNTSNMLSIINDVSSPLLYAIRELSLKIDQAVNAEHTGGDSTSHVTQNN